MNVSWLDSVVGFEDFPDGDWWNDRILSTPILDPKTLIGFTPNGQPVFNDPSDPTRGHVITQGVINTGGLFGPGAGQMSIGGVALTQAIKNMSVESYRSMRDDDDDDLFLKGLSWKTMSLSAQITDPNAFKFITGA